MAAAAAAATTALMLMLMKKNENPLVQPRLPVAIDTIQIDLVKQLARIILMQKCTISNTHTHACAYMTGIYNGF